MKNKFKDKVLTITLIKGNGKTPTAMRNDIDPNVNIRKTTWGKFVQFLDNQFEIADKSNLNAFIPCGWETENYQELEKKTSCGKPMIRRIKENIDYVHALTLDIDGAGVPISTFISANRHLEFYLHTSSNHKVKDGGDRYRVIFPLETAIRSNELFERRGKLADYFNRIWKTIDDLSTFTRGRLFYLPGVSKKEHKENYFKYHNKGEKLLEILDFPKDEKSLNGVPMWVNVSSESVDDTLVSYDELTEFQRDFIDGRAQRYMGKYSNDSKGSGDTQSFKLAGKLNWLGVPRDKARYYMELLRINIGSKAKFNVEHKLNSVYRFKNQVLVNVEYIPREILTPVAGSNRPISKFDQLRSN